MIKNVTVTVCYPVQFTMDIDTEDDIFEVRHEMRNIADGLIDSSSIESSVMDCSDSKYEEF